MTRVRRDCACPIARHQHGTKRAYLYDRCRCGACSAANAAWSREYRRTVAQRHWNGGSAWTDATGTRRRMQALCAAGWSPAVLAPMLGVTISGIRWLRTVDGVCLARTAARVRAVYERLWWQTPTGNTVERTARWAARAGWAEPWQWETVDIDDPDAQPVVAAVAPTLDEIAVERFMHGTLHAAPNYPATPELLEAVRRLTGRGLTDREIGERVGLSADAVLKLRTRHGIPTGPRALAEAS